MFATGDDCKRVRSPIQVGRDQILGGQQLQLDRKTRAHVSKSLTGTKKSLSGNGDGVVDEQQQATLTFTTRKNRFFFLRKTRKNR